MRTSPNVIVDIPSSSMVRYLASSSNEYAGGRDWPQAYTLTSTVMELVARDLSCMYDTAQQRPVININRPAMSESRTHIGKLFKPIVAVRCNRYDITSLDGMVFLKEKGDKKQWMVPGHTWKPYIGQANRTRFSWGDSAN